MSEIEKAAREHLKRLASQNMQARDRRGYELHPDDSAEAADWERVASWPER